MSAVEAVLYPTHPPRVFSLAHVSFVPLSGLFYFQLVLLSSAMYYYVCRRDVAWTWRIIKVTHWVGLKYV